MLGTRVEPESYRSLVSRAEASRDRVFDFDEAVFRRDYNRRAFQFRHHLCGHPLFELDALFALCRRMPPNEVKFRTGEIPIDAEFDSSLQAYRGDLTLEDAIVNFQRKKTYIAIYNPESDDAYRSVIEGILGEIGAHTRSLDPHINWYSSYIFLSTGGSVTPYHMDREMNFLLQVAGGKHAKLWGRLDDAVMTSAERDRLLGDASELRPRYRESLESLAQSFDLTPGTGLHHPFIAPHLITTRSDLSISLAVTYRTELSDIWTDAHALNHRLRKLRLSPSPVGIALHRDRRKARALRLLRRARRSIRTRLGR